MSVMQTLQSDSFFNELMFKDQPAAPQSFTVVHVQRAAENESVSKSPSFPHNSVGQRQPLDRVIYFASRNVTNELGNFASELFEFEGSEGQIITSVGFTFDVSSFIYPRS